MMRRKQIVAAALIGLTLAVVRATPAYDSLAESARNFHQTYQSLGETERSLSTVDRFVYSLLLSGSKSAQNSHPASQPQPRS
jgi:hypothetical protein